MRGKIATSQSWSTSLWVVAFPTVGAGFTQAQLNVLATDVDALAVTCFATFASSVSADTSFIETGVYAYPTGSAVSTQVALSPPRAASVGTGAGLLPVQTSCVVSLRTATSSRSGRGRNYLPFTGATLTGAHQFGTTAINNASLAYQAYLQALNAYTSGPANVTSLVAIVASRTTGAHPAITHITDHSDPDVQRRRSDKLLATSQVAQAI